MRGIAQAQAETFTIPYRDLWQELCSYENLHSAYKKARKHKTTKDYVIKFEKALEHNLLLLRSELLLHCYKPKPLVNFIIRDPKTRKISKSDFRDRVVHHALCNIIEPIFEKCFIYDSYANRIGKGTLKSIERFDFFKRKASRNNIVKCYILKADIRKYFENIDCKILISIIQKRIADKKIIWLIRKILANSSSQNKGMPLGNLTSQFFANVYLNKLDQFVKHKLRAKFYIRYVDDFVILEPDKEKLNFYKRQIDEFLKNSLRLQLHEDKSKILKLCDSVNFLGFRVFYYYKLLKRSNLRKLNVHIRLLQDGYKNGLIDYDEAYDFIEGWGDMYYLITNILSLSGERVIELFLLRGGIEGFHREAKQQLGLEDYQLRNSRGIERYLFLVLLVYVLLLLMLQQQMRRTFENKTIGELCTKLKAECNTILLQKAKHMSNEEIRKIAKERAYGL